jgi:hypothetical protein
MFSDPLTSPSIFLKGASAIRLDKVTPKRLGKIEENDSLAWAAAGARVRKFRRKSGRMTYPEHQVERWPPLVGL